MLAHDVAHSALRHAVVLTNLFEREGALAIHVAILPELFPAWQQGDLTCVARKKTLEPRRHRSREIGLGVALHPHKIEIQPVQHDLRQHRLAAQCDENLAVYRGFQRREPGHRGRHQGEDFEEFFRREAAYRQPERFRVGIVDQALPAFFFGHLSVLSTNLATGTTLLRNKT